MSKRDPETTARNRIDAVMTAELTAMLPEVLKATGFHSVGSLHGKIGGKHAEFMDIQHAVFYSADEFVQSYLQGYKKQLEERGGSGSIYDTYELLRDHPVFWNYLLLFLKRTYLRNTNALSKKRPLVDESEVWIGENNADYGLLITPRFVNGVWENDKSEIRHFAPNYWSIGHVMHTGLVVPGSPDKIEFRTVKDYLIFFQNVIVRNSGSPYEKGIAQLYSDYVLSSPEPLKVPLLIPEYRYEGRIKKHEFRLDFTIIEPVTLSKFGFELSPWSSHGYLAKIKGLTQKEVNTMALDNFEKEMDKHKKFFIKHGIFVRIYTDKNLKDLQSIFNDMLRHLTPKTVGTQLRYHTFEEFFK